MKRVALAAMLAVAACAPRIDATKDGGIASYSPIRGRSEMLAEINHHCASFGKNAKITGWDREDASVVFDCR